MANIYFLNFFFFFISGWSLHAIIVDVNLYLRLFTGNLYPGVGSLGYSNYIFTMVARVQRSIFNGHCFGHYSQSCITKFHKIHLFDWWHFDCTCVVGHRIHVTFLSYATSCNDLAGNTHRLKCFKFEPKIISEENGKKKGKSRKSIRICIVYRV